MAGISISGEVLYFETPRLKTWISGRPPAEKYAPAPEIYKIVLQVNEGILKDAILTINYDSKHASKVAALFKLSSRMINGMAGEDLLNTYQINLGDNNDYSGYVSLDHKNSWGKSVSSTKDRIKFSLAFEK